MNLAGLSALELATAMQAYLVVASMPSTLKIELIYWPATTFAARARGAGGAVPLHRRMAETAPHPTRTRGAFARRIRGCMASQAASTRSATLQRKGAEKPR